MGLVLRRKKGETIRINDDCVIVFHHVNNQRAKVEIKAPESVKILRGEIENGESIQEAKS